MKKYLYFIIFFVVSIFSNLYSKIAYGLVSMGHPIYGAQMERMVETFKQSGPIIFTVASVMLSIFGFLAIRNKALALITFKDNGQEITKLCRIISTDKEKIIYKEGQTTCTCMRFNLIKIQEKNGSKKVFIAVFLLSFLIFIAWEIVDYITTDVPDYNRRGSITLSDTPDSP